MAAVLFFSHPAATKDARRNIVIRNDTGGPVAQRIDLVRHYMDAQVSVEIRGEYCLSACTLYLGVPDACVLPSTRFGFHGPASRHYGIALPHAAFERWSRAMAELYPEPLKDWFLQTARYRVVGFYTISGARLIKMGLRPCARKVG